MKKATILVIDDESSIRRFLRVSLEAEGYQMEEAATASEGIAAAASRQPDLIILDLSLPDASGQSVLERLREWSHTPVLVLTVQDSDDDKVKLLDAGADDYLTKPFSVPELLARIRVALRHVKEAENPVATFRTGSLEIDFSAHLVRVDGKEVHLTSTEYEILRILARYAGKVVTHRSLLKEIWGPNAVEHVQYLRVHLGQIRKKLKTAGFDLDLIITEPGVGYRLITSKS